VTGQVQPLLSGHEADDCVTQHLASKGVNAEQWTEAVSQVIGGKTGGKEPVRQGFAGEPAKLSEGVSEAERWLSEKVKELKL
jgi:alanyl-tRNA synthetase